MEMLPDLFGAVGPIAVACEGKGARPPCVGGVRRCEPAASSDVRGSREHDFPESGVSGSNGSRATGPGGDGPACAAGIDQQFEFQFISSSKAQATSIAEPPSPSEGEIIAVAKMVK